MTGEVKQVRTPTAEELADSGYICPSDVDSVRKVARRYAVAVPSLALKEKGELPPSPGLMRQFIPGARELDAQPFELEDPISDARHAPVRGIVHRYRNRVLLKIVSVCPVYCRFCFRREMIGPGKQDSLTNEEQRAALDYIAAHPEISEVIMTGGDPLILSPRRVRNLTKQLSRIPHLARLRWHSRVPVLMPERITSELISALTQTTQQVRIAIHANHPDELTPAAEAAIRSLSDARIDLLSQSVLLRGVNDDAAILSSLYRKFQFSNVQAYYLHQLDLAPGTSHFRVSIQEGKAIMEQLSKCLVATPKPSYMLDIPGGFGKVNILSDAVTYLRREKNFESFQVRDPGGGLHIYRDYGTPDSAASNQPALHRQIDQFGPEPVAGDASGFERYAS